jgi:hypothetical protein
MVIPAALVLTACATPRVLHPSGWQLPWRRAAPTAPQAVNELRVESDGGATPQLAQYWDRNALRLDLTALAGNGSLSLRSQPPNGWPVRMEFTVRPGSLHHLEVSGEQRVVFTLAEAGETQTLPLAPGVYGVGTEALQLRWD